MKTAPAASRHFFQRTKCCAVVLLLAWSFAVRVFSAGGDLDPTFDPGTGADRPIHWTSLQRDGRIIIGGVFSSYNGTSRKGIARLNSDGSLDGTFNPGTGVDDEVLVTALQPDGKIIIGGRFTTYNGIARNHFARLNSDGSLDTTFDPGAGLTDPIASGHLFTIALQPDGRIIIGGLFSEYNGTARRCIARVNSDGSLDTTFNPGTGADTGVTTSALQPDGKLIIGGWFHFYNNTARRTVARLNANGSLDTSFDPGSGTEERVYTTALQPDGKVIIGGNFVTSNGTARRYIARLNSDGFLDTTFDPGGGLDGAVERITVQPDGKFIIGGDFWIPGAHIARLNVDGSLDSTFDPGAGANDSILTTALQADGKIIIGGYFTSYRGTSRNHIARLLPATGAISFSSASYSVGEGGGSATMTLTRTGGTDNKVVARVTLTDVTTSPADYIFSPAALDTSFYPGGATPGFGANFVQTTAVQPDGKVLVGGFYFDYSGMFRKGIARLNSNGSLDATFDPGTGTSFGPGTGGNAAVLTTALQADGKILIGGDFKLYNETSRTYVARLNPNGSLDSTFDAGNIASQPVRTISVQPDGKIIIGGDDITYDGMERTFIARLNSNGSRDTSFHPGTTVFPSVLTTALQPDGRIIIGGDFQNYAGTSRNFIARLNSNGSLDASFDSGPGGNGVVLTTDLQPDGKIIIGGYSTFVRVNSDGSLDPSFNPGTGPDSAVRAALLQSDGKIIIAGDFQTYNGIDRNFIARVNSDGSLDTTFDPGDGTNTGLRTLAFQPDGAIIIGGGFNRYNLIAQRGVARLSSGDFFATWPAGDATDKTFQLPIVDDSLLEANETLTFTLIPLIGGATLGANPTATLTIVSITVTTTFAIWQQKHFSPQELSQPAISGDAADPDGDGLSNLLEYAFHLDPGQSSAASGPYSSMDANYFSLIYTKAIAATDLTYTIEESSDLIIWSAVFPVNVILADNGVTQTVKAQVPIMGVREMSLRLRVSR